LTAIQCQAVARFIEVALREKALAALPSFILSLMYIGRNLEVESALLKN